MQFELALEFYRCQDELRDIDVIGAVGNFAFVNMLLYCYFTGLLDY